MTHFSVEVQASFLCSLAIVTQVTSCINDIDIPINIIRVVISQITEFAFSSITVCYNFSQFLNSVGNCFQNRFTFSEIVQKFLFITPLYISLTNELSVMNLSAFSCRFLSSCPQRFMSPRLSPL